MSFITVSRIDGRFLNKKHALIKNLSEAKRFEKKNYAFGELNKFCAKNLQFKSTNFSVVKIKY